MASQIPYQKLNWFNLLTGFVAYQSRKLGRLGFTWWAGALVAALPLIIGAAIVVHTPDAQACRDCPFPLRVASGRWLMPNKQLEVQIHEEPFDESSMRVFVILRDARSKDVLATGETVRLNFKNNFSIQLADHGGRLVRGQIRWINKSEDVIQARFMCQGACTIQRYFDSN